jgi:hypothetical protein
VVKAVDGRKFDNVAGFRCSYRTASTRLDAESAGSASLLDIELMAQRNNLQLKREPVWCKYSNEVYDIVIKQHYG